MSERNSQIPAEVKAVSQMDTTGGIKVIPANAAKRSGRGSAASIKSSAAARLASPLRVTGIDT